MVCDFCPGSGFNPEKTFNRADVFKRHLTSVHVVVQTPPSNSRSKAPSRQASKKNHNGHRSVLMIGTCSICNVTFANAQIFYEHLDDCVLRVVQQADPSEAINLKHLTTISDDEAVRETLKMHMLPTSVDMSVHVGLHSSRAGDPSLKRRNPDPSEEVGYERKVGREPFSGPKKKCALNYTISRDFTEKGEQRTKALLSAIAPIPSFQAFHKSRGLATKNRMPKF